MPIMAKAARERDSGGTNRNRASPARLVKLYKYMNSEQRNIIKKAGFGGLLCIRTSKLPVDLINWLLSHFQSESTSLVLPGRDCCELMDENGKGDAEASNRQSKRRRTNPISNANLEEDSEDEFDDDESDSDEEEDLEFEDDGEDDEDDDDGEGDGDDSVHREDADPDVPVQGHGFMHEEHLDEEDEIPLVRRSVRIKKAQTDNANVVGQQNDEHTIPVGGAALLEDEDDGEPLSRRLARIRKGKSVA